jgi:uracil phosphoribosyltransferase
VQTLVVDHPLAAQHLTRLRDEATDRAAFRLAMDGLAEILVYEATRSLAVDAAEVRTPLGPAAGVRVADPPLVVPVLRAGLGMLPAVLRLLPEAPTGFIGVARNEATFVPEPYMNSVPLELGGRDVLVLDPMLATGGSL